MPIPADVANLLVEKILGDLRQQTYTIPVPTAEEFQAAAKHVLHVMEGPGPDSQEPGGFTIMLIRTMCRADEVNLKKLSHVYPAIAASVHLYKHTDDGIEVLRGLSHLLH